MKTIVLSFAKLSEIEKNNLILLKLNTLTQSWESITEFKDGEEWEFIPLYRKENNKFKMYGFGIYNKLN